MTPTQYFKSHSLNPKFLKDTFAVTTTDTHIIIPIYDINAKLLFCRYRHLTGTTKFTSDKGASPALFPIHKVKKETDIILCEGEPDCMRLWQEDIPAVTGTSGVKTFSPSLAAPLKGKKVAIVLDNDKAGQSSIKQYHDTLLAAGAIPTIIILPKKYKDVCDYFTAGHTKAQFLKLPKLSLDEWLEQNEPEDFGWESANELLGRKIPKNKWLVDRIIPTEGFCFMVGQEATGKSFYALTLAQSVATGEPWLGKFVVTKKASVLIIDKENTKKRTQDRIRGLKMKHDNIFWLKFPSKLEIADSETESGYSPFVESVARKVKKNNIRFLIIDSFTDILTGNENDRGEVQKFFDAMRQLFPDIAILILHHSSKPSQGLIRTSSQKARGSTNIMAQTYSAFHVECLLKSKTEFTVEQTKAGDAEKLKKFMVAMSVEADPINEGETLVTKLEYAGEVKDADEKNQEAITVIEEIFSTTSQIPRQNLLEVCKSKGVSRGTVDRAIKIMKEEGVIDSIRAGKFTSYILAGQRGKIYEE